MTFRKSIRQVLHTATQPRCSESARSQKSLISRRKEKSHGVFDPQCYAKMFSGTPGELYKDEGKAEILNV